MQQQIKQTLLDDLNLSKVKSFELPQESLVQELDQEVSKLTQLHINLKYQGQQLSHILIRIDSLYDIFNFQTEKLKSYTQDLQQIQTILNQYKATSKNTYKIVQKLQNTDEPKEEAFCYNKNIQKCYSEQNATHIYPK
ncbi:Hypothetical_protein [Hexamita inflata]|uniref:Hypothetical_protein n=1 Tax=Hexamita inflata TaxID=28002 RepID=A0AA86NWG9_9EUKA|nr:Hypothetical protein HINF_LOCUS15537 [Hexamita inflata]